MFEVYFSPEMFKLALKEANRYETGSPLGHQVEGHPRCLFPAHGDVLVDTQSSRGAHHKIKLAALLDYKYKTGVDQSVQMLSFYSFERMTIKGWKKLFFHLYDLVAVGAHIFHNKSKKKISLEVYEKVAEGLLASAGTEIRVQGQISNSAGRLVGRDHSVYRISSETS